ncbi:Kelch repeat-containing protein [Paenibacillus contaminans]|uniref:Fibronectin type-III domain-containing protein n=1 Tax=Paenibacillus contaminans TaxID=450362 RepID=A0A329MQH3_9BACL|nr:fibronectin type III domain-containing protein [Paenibacillus contaminans]RAV22231.1 hypothetical protein DQG23_04570 [Paenibacillus contaminans]
MKSVSKFLLSLCLSIIMFTSVLAIPSLAAENTWTTKAPMLSARGNNFGVAEYNGKIYVFGGRNSSSVSIAKVEEYNPITNTWTNKQDMPTAREPVGAATINGKIYVFGGHVNGGYYQTAVEVYDPATDTWSTKTSIPNPEYFYSLVEVDGKVYLFGGSSKKVLVYDSVTDTWSEKAQQPAGRETFDAVNINGKIYTIGMDNVLYDPTTDTWTPKANPPVSAGSTALTYANGKLYLLGGYKSSGNQYLNNLYEYDPNTDTWTARANMLTARSSHEAINVNGSIYAIGGYNASFLKTVEMYSPPTPEQPAAPINLTATGGNAKVDLSWSAVAGATGYNVKRSTTEGGPYTTIATGVAGTTYTDTAVTNGTTYYYVVTAVNAGGESANSNEASATPQAPASTGRAILTITLMNGIEKEYDLSMAEVNAFTSWYDAKADGTGPARYTLDDPHAKGPFKARKDNIIFDKIITFDIDEYTPEN